MRVEESLWRRAVEAFGDLPVELDDLVEDWDSLPSDVAEELESLLDDYEHHYEGLASTLERIADLLGLKWPYRPAE